MVRYKGRVTEMELIKSEPIENVIRTKFSIKHGDFQELFKLEIMYKKVEGRVTLFEVNISNPPICNITCYGIGEDYLKSNIKKAIQETWDVVTNAKPLLPIPLHYATNKVYDLIKEILTNNGLQPI